MSARFQPGRILVTPAAEALLARLRPENPAAMMFDLLERHLSGDWGDCDDHDKAINDRFLEANEGRLHSFYGVGFEDKLYIITDGLGLPEVYTTLLTPWDY